MRDIWSSYSSKYGRISQDKRQRHSKHCNPENKEFKSKDQQLNEKESSKGNLTPISCQKNLE